MKTLTNTFAFKFVVVGVVLGSVAFAVRLFAQEKCLDVTAITTKYIVEIKEPTRIKMENNGLDTFSDALKGADPEAKGGTCIVFVWNGTEQKAPPYTNLRTSASTTASKASSPASDGATHVTQALDVVKQDLASSHVTQRVATNSPAALAKVLACFEEPPLQKPISTPSPRPSVGQAK